MRGLIRRAGGRLALTSGRIALAIERLRRSRSAHQTSQRSLAKPFEIHTFVTDDAMYAEMRRSFVDAGFDPECFVRLTDERSEPYAAISAIGGVGARYPILCHQDVRADQGVGAGELLGALEQLDAIDASWVVAGNGGVSRNMRIVRRLRDPHGGSTRDRVPAAAQTLDENFLVFNTNHPPRCTEALSGFHLYGADVCLNALKGGGSAYVIDFPLTHLSGGEVDDGYRRVREGFLAVWNRQCLFRYVATPNEVLFVSRFSLLRRTLGSARVLSWAWSSMYEASDLSWRR